jgi:branched-chain amino acid transport system permease protein
VIGLLAQTGPNGFAEMVAEGLSLGSIYALLGMGLVIIFKATQVLNFAHGALTAAGAYLVAAFATILDVPGRWMPDAPAWFSWSLSVLAALAAAALLGILAERLFIRPMVGEELFSVALVTLGIDIALRNITNDFIGTDARPMGDPWGTEIIDLGWVTTAQSEVAQLITSLVVFGLVGLFFRSRTGIAMRATAFDQEAARAQGINVGRVFASAWAIGAVLAAIAGLFISIFPRRSAGVDPETAFFVFRAFPVVILGGLDSVVGAILGGFIIGLAESAAVSYLQFEFLGAGFGGIAGPNDAGSQR